MKHALALFTTLLLASIASAGEFAPLREAPSAHQRPAHSGTTSQELHVFQGQNPDLFKDLSDPTVHGYNPDKYLESYKMLYGDQAAEKIAAMKKRREELRGKQRAPVAKDFSKVPAHLKGYEALYAKHP